MNIFNRAHQAVSHIDLSPFSQSLLTNLSTTQKRVAVIAAVALGILLMMTLVYKCCTSLSGINSPYVPYVPPQPYVPPYQPQPYVPPYQPQPYQPQPYQPNGGVNAPHGNQDPLVKDEKRQDLLDIEQTIAKIREELHELDFVQNQRAEFGLDEFEDEFEQLPPQDFPQDPPVVDKAPPALVDVNALQDPPAVIVGDAQMPQAVDSKDDQQKAEQDDLQDPNDLPVVIEEDAPQDPPIVDDVNVLAPQVPDPKVAKDDQKSPPAKPAVVPVEEGLSKSEARIFELREELEKTLLKYPDVLRAYLENRFSNYGRKDKDEIFGHILILTGCMEKYCDQTQFILKGFEAIDQFLTNSLFTSTTESCLQEEVKVDLIVFQAFFKIVDDHYPLIETHDPELALRLKIKFANLPLIDANVDRTSFKNIYLDEDDQRIILIHHFQTREDEAVDLAIKQLKTKSMTEQEAKHLSRDLAGARSRLSYENRQKLRDALSTQMGHKKPLTWDHEKQVYDALKNYFTINPYVNPVYSVHQDPFQMGNIFNPNPYGQDPAKYGLNLLYMACKSKNYFTSQTEIPRWYHATPYANLDPIIKSGEIRVEHRKAFAGAWVSTQREPSMGDCVFIFNHSIAQLDPNVRIEYEKGKVRWRGLQKAIPLVEQKNPGAGKNDVVPHVALIGLSHICQKPEKQKVVQLLKAKGIANPKVVSVTVVDYIQREILLKIGNPNLTEKWWGKADVQQLDNPIAQAGFHG